MKQIVGIPSIICAALLMAGCVSATQSEYDRLLQNYEATYGKPRSEWTNDQRAEFLQEVAKVYERNQKQIASTPPRQPIVFPTIQPPVFPMPTPRQSTTSRVVPDGQGGYTVWNGDGTTTHMVPDGHGGWTIWH